MTEQPSLLDWYPDSPGYRNRDTSRAAAEAIKPTINERQKACLVALELHGPMTADECAAKLNKHFMSIRPRMSELALKGLVRDTGIVRPSALGNDMIVWVIA